jgi:hypothetical protein
VRAKLHVARAKKKECSREGKMNWDGMPALWRHLFEDYRSAV